MHDRVLKSNRSGYFIRAQAARADVNSLVSTVDNGFYLFDIGFPGSVCLTVGVRNLQTENNALSANITLCHAGHLPLIQDGSYAPIRGLMVKEPKYGSALLHKPVT